VPEHSTQLAELVGIGRGVDLILYIWVCISLSDKFHGRFGVSGTVLTQR
jgi:hypothetical protein